LTHSTNAYWLAQMNTTQIDKAFADLQAAGYTTVRTWFVAFCAYTLTGILIIINRGFNEVTANPGYGAWYQLWQNGVGTINTGADGLGKFG